MTTMDSWSRALNHCNMSAGCADSKMPGRVKVKEAISRASNLDAVITVALTSSRSVK